MNSQWTRILSLQFIKLKCAKGHDRMTKYLRRKIRVVWAAILSFLFFIYLLMFFCKESNNIAQMTESKKFRLWLHAEEINSIYRERAFPKVWRHSLSGLTETCVCSDLENLRKSSDFVKYSLQSIVGDVPLYIHDPKTDYISSEVIRLHNFEPQNFETIYSYLMENEEMNLIDVGANIGIISLQAAKLGRKVISIDADKSNIQHICASALENNAGGSINLIHNAVSDNYTTVSFVMGKDGEHGASFMDDQNLRHNKLKMSAVKFDTENLVEIETVLLDDLLHLPNINDFKTVFIKLDIEGSENKALLGARKLFQKLKVRGVLMEWRWHVNRTESKSVILKFMDEFGFEPYGIGESLGNRLEGQTMNNSDVIWLPKHR